MSLKIFTSKLTKRTAQQIVTDFTKVFEVFGVIRDSLGRIFLKGDKQTVYIDEIATKSEIAEVKEIATGASIGIVFATEQQMNDWLAGTYQRPDGVKPSNLIVGEDIYIVDTAAPDYWWDGTSMRLQSVKLDLSGYMKAEDYGATFNEFRVTFDKGVAFDNPILLEYLENNTGRYTGYLLATDDDDYVVGIRPDYFATPNRLAVRVRYVNIIPNENLDGNWNLPSDNIYVWNGTGSPFNQPISEKPIAVNDYILISVGNTPTLLNNGVYQIIQLDGSGEFPNAALEYIGAPDLVAVCISNGQYMSYDGLYVRQNETDNDVIQIYYSRVDKEQTAPDNPTIKDKVISRWLQAGEDTVNTYSADMLEGILLNTNTPVQIMMQFNALLPSTGRSVLGIISAFTGSRTTTMNGLSRPYVVGVNLNTSGQGVTVLLAPMDKPSALSALVSMANNRRLQVCDLSGNVVWEYVNSSGSSAHWVIVPESVFDRLNGGFTIRNSTTGGNITLYDFSYSVDVVTSNNSLPTDGTQNEVIAFTDTQGVDNIYKCTSVSEQKWTLLSVEDGTIFKLGTDNYLYCYEKATKKLLGFERQIWEAIDTFNVWLEQLQNIFIAPLVDNAAMTYNIAGIVDTKADLPTTGLSYGYRYLIRDTLQRAYWNSSPYTGVEPHWEFNDLLYQERYMMFDTQEIYYVLQDKDGNNKKLCKQQLQLG